MFVIQGDLQGQKVNLKLKFWKILFLTNTNIASVILSFDLILKIHLW